MRTYSLDISEHIVAEDWYRVVINDLLPEREWALIIGGDCLIELGDDDADRLLFYVAKHLMAEAGFIANVFIRSKRKDVAKNGKPIVYRPFNFYKQLARRNNMTAKRLCNLTSGRTILEFTKGSL